MVGIIISGPSGVLAVRIIAGAQAGDYDVIAFVRQPDHLQRLPAAANVRSADAGNIDKGERRIRI
jgi:hypothetical protein